MKGICYPALATYIKHIYLWYKFLHCDISVKNTLAPPNSVGHKSKYFLLPVSLWVSWAFCWFEPGSAGLTGFVQVSVGSPGELLTGWWGLAGLGWAHSHAWKLVGCQQGGWGWMKHVSSSLPWVQRERKQKHTELLRPGVERAWHHFCCILLAKETHETSPDSGLGRWLHLGCRSTGKYSFNRAALCPS